MIHGLFYKHGKMDLYCAEAFLKKRNAGDHRSFKVEYFIWAGILADHGVNQKLIAEFFTRIAGNRKKVNDLTVAL